MKTSTKIQGLEDQSGLVLFECDANAEGLSRAYQLAKDYEQMDVAVRLSIPGAPQSLIESLSVDEANEQLFYDSIKQEIDDHDHDGKHGNDYDEGCCAKTE